MKLGFESAREHLWDNYKTVSGLDPGSYFNWYEMYRDAFCDELTKLGFKTGDDYSRILTQMSACSSVSDFLKEPKQQIAELAAFGLISFDRIIQEITSNASHEEIFNKHEELAECLSYVVNSADIRRQARSGGLAKLANDPKQKAKAMVRECWDEWQKQPDRYKGKASFAHDMLDKFEDLKSQPVIEGWCRTWDKENATQPAQ